MKATYVRCIVRGKFGTIIERGNWYPATPENIKMLKEANRITASVESSGRTYHLVYSHPVSDKQRKALEHGQRLRTLEGAVGSINAMMSQHSKELRAAFPDTCLEIAYAVELLRNAAEEFRQKGPL